MFDNEKWAHPVELAPYRIARAPVTQAEFAAFVDDGGYAQQMRAKASHALAVPANLSSAEAAPLFCAGLTVYRALKNAGVGPNQRVAVFGIGGAGPIRSVGRVGTIRFVGVAFVSHG